MSAYNLVLERDINQIISLDTDKRPYGEEVGNFQYRTPSSYNDFSRVGLRDFLLYSDIPNINQYNNTFVCNSTSIIIQNGYYDNETLLASAIQTALNTYIPALAPFTVSFNAIPKNFTITNATSSNMSFVIPLPCAKTTGLITNLVPSPVYTSGQPTLIYTAYIDLISNRLTAYSKADEFLDGRYNILDRITLGRADYIVPYSFGDIKNIKWFKFVKNTNLGYIDIQLRDEYGNIFEVGKNCGTAFRLILTFLTKQSIED